MNKLELFQVLKDRTGLSKQEGIGAVKLFFYNLTEAMINWERIEIGSGFLHLPYVGVNTLDQVNSIEHKFGVYFKK
ncbi:HU family DNA-binding protein [Desulfobacter curvatus]|uniref:HU family DNA-binding protein n=1 Tax=Desulfobacter curvatus TaxID=2290 RepID=UPI00037F9954|nr:hypothetical protein [Desulfobacter curvatus]